MTDEQGLNQWGLLDYQDSDEAVEDERPDDSQLLADWDDLDVEPVAKYAPGQERDPKGTSTGGQFADGNGSSTTPAKPAGRTRRGEGYASVGGVNQHGGSLPVYVCNTCHKEVVWAESKRTGKKYLVDVRHNYNGARFYIGADIHKDPTPDEAADRAAAKQAKKDEIKARAGKMLLRFTENAQRQHKEGKITTEQFLADLDLFQREYDEDMARAETLRDSDY